MFGIRKKESAKQNYDSVDLQFRLIALMLDNENELDRFINKCKSIK